MRPRAPLWGRGRGLFLLLALTLAVGFPVSLSAGESLRVMTWNIWNYLPVNRHIDGGFRPDYPKPEVEKAALRTVIRSADPDLIILQEMGPLPYLLEFQRDLGMEGMHYPHAFLVERFDENRHLAALSRVPATFWQPEESLDFKYFEERLQPRRGLLGLEVVLAGKVISVYGVHLKSRWTVREDDPQSSRLRTGEAEAIRNLLHQRHPEGEGLFLIVGDFNDHPRSAPVRRFLQRGAVTFSHLLEAEDSRGERWTHHFLSQDQYSRIDHILVSTSLLPAVHPPAVRILDIPEVRVASDHRPLVVDLDLSALIEK